MSYVFASNAIDVFAVVMLIVGIGILSARSMGAALVLLAVQSLFLALAGLHAGLSVESWHILAGALLVVCVKCAAAPLLLWLVLKRLNITHDSRALLSRPALVFLGVATVIAAQSLLGTGPFETSIGSERVLSTAVGVVLIGILIMVTHQQALSQVVGFLVMENGMALAALTAFYGMPFVVELGIFLDLLLAVFVAFIYTQRMHFIFGSMDTDRNMRSLRG